MHKINVFFGTKDQTLRNLKMDIENVQCFFENIYKCFGDKIEPVIFLYLNDVDEIAEEIDKTYKEVK